MLYYVTVQVVTVQVGACNCWTARNLVLWVKNTETRARRRRRRPNICAYMSIYPYTTICLSVYLSIYRKEFIYLFTYLSVYKHIHTYMYTHTRTYCSVAGRGRCNGIGAGAEGRARCASCRGCTAPRNGGWHDGRPKRFPGAPRPLHQTSWSL